MAIDSRSCAVSFMELSRSPTPKRFPHPRRWPHLSGVVWAHVSKLALIVPPKNPLALSIFRNQYSPICAFVGNVYVVVAAGAGLFRFALTFTFPFTVPFPFALPSPWDWGSAAG